MKILYESTVLRLASLQECAKTGIYRVVDELLKQLLLMDDIHVYPFIIDFLHEDSNLLIDEYGLNDKQYIRNHEIWNKHSFLFDNCFTPLVKAREKVKNSSKNGIVNTLNRKAYSFLINNMKIFMKENNFQLNLHDYDICHFLTYKINKKFKKIKSLYTIYDLIPIKFPELLSADIVRKEYIDSMKRVNGNTWITCISESTRNDLLNAFPKIDPEKVSVNHISVSNNIKKVTNKKKINEVLNKYSLNMESNYLISVSTIEPRKNMISVLKAFKNLINNSNYDDLKLVLVGPQGWKFDNLLEEINLDRRLVERVIFTGFVTDDELSVLYTNAKIFLYVSLYEGFGIPPLEAMRCGTPVITSNNSSLPEVVGDGAIMVEPLDIEEIENSIKLILEDSNFTRELLQRSEERIKLFSWKNYGQEIKELYMDIYNS